MTRYQVLYNPYASNNQGKIKAEALTDILTDYPLVYNDITKIEHLKSFILSLGVDDKIIICGGDGTLNRFVNSIDVNRIENEIYLFATGTGNDFLRDIGKDKTAEPILINEYLKHLPVVTVKGKSYKFINNASFGLDGYCCEEADRQRNEKGKSSNYALLAIKGLLFAYKPRNAVVIVDGVKKEYKKVWLAPTMNGRFFGGGLMSAPGQNRLNKEHTVSVVAMCNVGKLKALLIFPSMFKGKHIKYKDNINVIEGHEITVIYDKPAPMQIDGETILDVTRCDIKTSNCVLSL
ncbi:MAG: diacylglycerol kinase family protein [Acutalibacteraceae bacterium]|nr:diacylglycerol kinase family protein [Acutalibacteraceae bacterium]